MNIVLTALEYLGYVLIFPGFLFCFITGMLLCGIDRKIVAKMQKRVGPPVLQPFYDFFKLCGKETIVPAAASGTVFMAAPIVGLAALVVLQLFIPIHGFTAFSGMADVIVILYLLLIPAMAAMLGGAASGSPYAGIGLSREMVTVISCELPLVLVLLAVGKVAGGDSVTFSMSNIVKFQLDNGSLITHASLIPAAIAFLLIIPGETGSHPFDTAEAETGLFTALFLGGIGVGIPAIDALIMFAFSVIITIVTVSLVHAVTARLKIEQVFKYYWTIVTALALVSLVMAWYGL